MIVSVGAALALRFFSDFSLSYELQRDWCNLAAQARLNESRRRFSLGSGSCVASPDAIRRNVERSSLIAAAMGIPLLLATCTLRQVRH